MNRLTRCPACATVFRVSEAQLDSRQGFVRCGQCAKVFDARASLAEERDLAPPHVDEPVRPPHDDAASPTTADGLPPSTAERTDPTADAPPASAEAEADPFDGMDVEEIVLSLDDPDANTPGEPHSTDTPEPTATAATPQSTPEVATLPPPSAPRAPLADDGEPLPFGPKHRARSRAAAAAWGVGAFVLLVVLAAQAALWFRGEVATLLPEIRPYLELACRPLHCTVPPSRQTGLISIESSELQVDKNVPGLLTLNATLRNRAEFAQAHPSIELTLTDGDDRPLSRRVLAPSDYLGGRLAKEPLFPAVSEHSVRLHIDATSFKPTGYRLFLFHP
jgi:predicted Zn finger-like uncharacterized protein